MDFADVCSMQEIELGARRAMRIRELTVVATATQRRAPSEPVLPERPPRIAPPIVLTTFPLARVQFVHEMAARGCDWSKQ